MNGGSESVRIFAVAAPGVEELLVAELRELGLPAEVVQGGVEWEGPMEHVQLANLHSRLATRVLVRIAEFRARTFHELERHAGRVPWSRYLPPGRSLQLRVSCRKSKLYHEGAVAERLLRAAEAAVGSLSPTEVEADEEGEPAGEGQLLVVRFLHDRCTISADSSGAPLYRRGYRQALARAPLRETLAAAMLRATGWDGTVPLLDPMCGSGTIAIEAALLARRIAPGLANAGLEPRAFAFQSWPEHDGGGWARVVERARAEVRPAAGVAIQASDRDEGAVTAARANAERAGVSDDLRIERMALSSVEPPGEPGLLLTNPPYGVRVSRGDELRNLYAALGRLAHERLPGWSVALLSTDQRLRAQVGLPLRELLRTRTGGIEISLAAARVPTPDREEAPDAGA
jgi:putative N6-adenine-specific DNA methylase